MGEFRKLLQYKMNIQPDQCSIGYRRDCPNKRTCMFRHIDENVGDPISKYTTPQLAKESKSDIESPNANGKTLQLATGGKLKCSNNPVSKAPHPPSTPSP